MALSSRPRRFIILTFASLCTLGGLLLWLDENHLSQPVHPAKTQAIQPSQTLTPRLPKVTKPRLLSGSPRVNSEEIWDIDPTGRKSSITLALDEAMLRDADGKDILTKLSPPATQESLPARLAGLSAPLGVFPVAYVTGEERSTASRRIVTPDLRVQMDTTTANQIAVRHQLALKDIPDYAPGWVIFTAANPFAALDAMVNLRAVSSIASADVLLAAQQSLRALPNDLLITNQWHLKKTAGSAAGTDVNIETAWNYPAAIGSRGAGIRIGIVDDGLQTAHPDLAPNVDTANDKDWNGNDADPNPGSGDDHGTACAGVAAAKGNNGIGVSGTAPDATLVGMRLISAAATDAQEAEAMNYLPNIVQIKSNSWGPSDTGTILEGPGALTLAALKTAAESGRNNKGSIIVWAAGNGGTAGDNSNYDGYANSIYTIAIGATDSVGRRANYSEPGANLVVCAPSSGAAGTLGITTADRTGTLGYNTATSANGGDYANDFGGTSSATPTVAGIIALLLEKNPNLGWRDVQEILIRTAVRPPASTTGWADNAAGISFNHDFGAGLINATAAVNLAATWANLGAQTSAVSALPGPSSAIPNNSATGISRTFDLSASNIRCEQVTLKLSATHTARGNLEITLTSPSGMVSKLSEVHSDSGDNYSNWTFSSVRHWGELSTGTWTLKVADLSSTGNSTGGTLTAAELKVFGASATPVNPAPVVLITQPINSQVFSPGATVNVAVTASDLTLAGGPGTITQVELFDNNVPIGIDTEAPYTFTFNPALGGHSLVARATDSDSAVGTSSSVNFTVVNQSPVITAAALSAMGQGFSEVPLTIASITASDSEGMALSYSYQWESSTNGTLFAIEPGATLATAPALPGKLLRCIVTASDGISTSAPFTTAAVNLLARPTTTAASGNSYSYTSGLVLRGTDSPLSRRAIIHEFSQGPGGGASEWIEILTLQAGSLAFWDLQDAAGNLIALKDDPIWDNIPAGTIIVIYNGASKDPLLPADDFTPADGKMVISSTNPAYFDSTYDAWLPLGNSGDTIFLSDDLSATVHSIAYGNSTDTPNIGSVGSGKSAYYAGDTDAGADFAVNWRTTTSLTPRNVQTRAAATLPIVFGGPWSPLPVGFTGVAMDTPYNSNLGGDTAIGSAKFGDQGDSITIEFSAQAAAMTYQVKGNPASPATVTAGTFLVQESASGTTYTTLRTVTNKTNVDTAYADAPAPSTRFIRFLYQTKSAGNIQLDKLSITGSVTNALLFTVTPTTFAENIGASATTGSVSISAALAVDLIVTLASSDTSEATLPATITIAVGQTSSPTFPIAAVDDLDSDGLQLVTLTATAAGYTNGTIQLTVTDNEPSVEGVTPGMPNNPANQIFVTAIRSGSLNSPALFRIGIGAIIPVGLSLNPGTGLLTGILSSTNPPGNYPIVIERYNSLGEVVTQSYTLTLTAVGGNTYATWIAGFSLPSLSGPADDFDQDGLSNAIENVLGTLPNAFSPGLILVSFTGSSLTFTHTRTNTPASDLASEYEWSSDLLTWNESGNAFAGITVSLAESIITDLTAPANDIIQVTATVTQGSSEKLFVRISTTLP
jgi:subtilisin-like proprotein convertase family protein